MPYIFRIWILSKSAQCNQRIGKVCSGMTDQGLIKSCDTKEAHAGGRRGCQEREGVEPDGISHVQVRSLCYHLILHQRRVCHILAEHISLIVCNVLEKLNAFAVLDDLLELDLGGSDRSAGMLGA